MTKPLEANHETTNILIPIIFKQVDQIQEMTKPLEANHETTNILIPNWHEVSLKSFQYGPME
jgi:hypothetical protein